MKSGLKAKSSMDLEITSKENPSYKELKSFSREKSNYLFIEGEKLLIEAIKSPLKIKKIYIDKENHLRFSSLLSECKEYELVFMKNELLASLFTTDTRPVHEELVIVLAEKPSWQLTDLFKTKKDLIFLEEVQDPGNLGTIIRSALAFNAGGIILSKNSVDPFNTKVIRGSAGALFNMPVVAIDSFDNFTYLVKKENYKLIATSAIAGKKINELNFSLPFIFLFGNEGKGLSEKLVNIAHETIAIPHSENLESLNLGISASIILWEQYKNKIEH